MIQTLARLYPFLNGYGRIANLPLVRQLIDWKTAGGVRGTLQNGVRFTAPSKDHVGRAAWLFGDLDPKLTRLADILVRQGDHVVDIGANFGLFSLHAAPMVGPSGCINAVEPQPGLAQMLRDAASENAFPQIRIHETALGTENGVATLNIPASNSGAASLIRHRKGDVRLSVAVEKSGSFLSKLGGERIRFMKMDVEGFEADVVRGAHSLFRQSKPDVIFCEAQRQCRKEDNEAVALLSESGYTCYPVLPSLRRIRLAGPDFTGSLEGVHDVLAVADGDVGRNVMDALQKGNVRLV